MVKTKNILGKKWAEKSGENFKYFMVFESKNVDGCYTAKNVLDIISADKMLIENSAFEEIKEALK